jgi:3-hydroxy acid dehydrogenase/malonic semialdehyde reductase
MACMSNEPAVFKERQSGHIINIGSIVGRDAHPTEAVYSATKFALHGFSDALRKELVSMPIRVTELQPGQHLCRRRHFCLR